MVRVFYYTDTFRATIRPMNMGRITIKTERGNMLYFFLEALGFNVVSTSSEVELPILSSAKITNSDKNDNIINSLRYFILYKNWIQVIEALSITMPKPDESRRIVRRSTSGKMAYSSKDNLVRVDS